MTSAKQQPQSTETLDRIADDLQQLRIEAGAVSYAEIASRIARHREAAGMTAASARVARSSVFDAFRSGRTRINADLVAEIVTALGGTDDDAEHWRSRCLRAVNKPKTSEPSSALQPRLVFVVILLAACVGLNLFGGNVAAKFHLLVYLDMIGTAVAAIALGPWYGALVGLTSGALGALGGVDITLSFTIVNVVGALVWGYGVHKFRADRSLLRFFFLGLVVAVACTLVATPINVLAYGGAAGHATDSITGQLSALGDGVWLAVFLANLSTSLADKFISGFAALGLVRVIGWHKLSMA